MKDPVVLRVPSCRWAVLPMVSFCRCALASCVNGQFYRWQVMLDDNFTGASDCAVGKITVFLFILKKVNFQTKKLLTTKIYYSFPSYKFGRFFLQNMNKDQDFFPTVPWSNLQISGFVDILFCILQSFKFLEKPASIIHYSQLWINIIREFELLSVHIFSRNTLYQESSSIFHAFTTTGQSEEIFFFS